MDYNEPDFTISITASSCTLVCPNLPVAMDAFGCHVVKFENKSFPKLKTETVTVLRALADAIEKAGV